jgi:hypothetical protein
VSNGRVREGTRIVEGDLTSLRLRRKEKKRKKERVRRLNTHVHTHQHTFSHTFAATLAAASCSGVLERGVWMII